MGLECRGPERRAAVAVQAVERVRVGVVQFDRIDLVVAEPDGQGPAARRAEVAGPERVAGHEVVADERAIGEIVAVGDQLVVADVDLLAVRAVTAAVPEHAVEVRSRVDPARPERVAPPPPVVQSARATAESRHNSRGVHFIAQL